MGNEFDLSQDTSGAETLRIGFFSESFHPVQNGVTTSMLTLMAELRAEKHHVFVFAPSHQGKREQETNVLRFPSFVSVFNRDYPLAYPFVPRLALEPYFSRLRLDIVHTHTPFILGLTGAKLALSRGMPLVTTFHTLYSQYSHYVPILPDSVTQGLLEYYLPWYYNRCSEIICPSETAAEALRAMGVEQPFSVIPTGVPLPPANEISEESRQYMREKIGVAWDTPLLLYAGRLAREKKVDWLLEVFAEVHHRMPEVRLALAGGGADFDELRCLAASLELGDSVLFLGPTPRREMDALYAAADIFCFPSPTETQGLVIGEARAAGVPCIVVNAGGSPETVRDGEDGFRVPPNDKKAFCARILQTLGDRDLRHRLRSNALRNARNFTPETMARRVLEVYERARLQTPHGDDIQTPPLPDDADWEAMTQATEGFSRFDNK